MYERLWLDDLWLLKTINYNNILYFFSAKDLWKALTQWNLAWKCNIMNYEKCFPLYHTLIDTPYEVG